MLVYLVRHGEAVPENVDPARPLSAKGQAEATDTALMLAAEGAKIDEIWHSTKLRAQETAEIIARTLGVKKVIGQKGLKPDDPATPLAALLRQTDKTILIAGHLPFLPKLANLLDPQLKLKELGTGEAVKIRF